MNTIGIIHKMLIDGKEYEVEHPKGMTVPVAFEGDKVHVLPAFKSRQYNYLHHHEAIEIFEDALDRQLTHYGDNAYTASEPNYTARRLRMARVYTPNLNYTWQKGLWEIGLRVPYEVQGSDTYRPRFILINDYRTGFSLDFGLWRSVCSNGMAFGRVYSTRLTLGHRIDKLLAVAREYIRTWLDRMLYGKWLQEVHSNLSMITVSRATMLNDIRAYFGERVSNKVQNVFEIPVTVDGVVAYNIVSYYATKRRRNPVSAADVVSDYHKLLLDRGTGGLQ